MAHTASLEHEWQTCMTVALDNSFATSSCISCAVLESTLAVHSSKHTIRGRLSRTLARHSSCCWPVSISVASDLVRARLYAFVAVERPARIGHDVLSRDSAHWADYVT